MPRDPVTGRIALSRSGVTQAIASFKRHQVSQKVMNIVVRVLGQLQLVGTERIRNLDRLNSPSRKALIVTSGSVQRDDEFILKLHRPEYRLAGPKHHLGSERLRLRCQEGYVQDKQRILRSH